MREELWEGGLEVRDGDVIRFHLFTHEELEETAQAEAVLADAGVTGRSVRAHGSIPLGDVLIAGSATLTALTHFLVSLRRQFKRGILVDALGQDGLVIRSDGTLPRGLVVVRHPDGQIDVRDGEGLGQALAGALGSRTPNGGTGRDGPDV